MKKVFLISVPVMAVVMMSLLIGVMAANRRSEKELESIDKVIAQFETDTTSNWIRVEAPTHEETTTDNPGSTVIVFAPATTTESIPADTIETTADPVLIETDYEETEEYAYPAGDVLNPVDGINYFYGTLETYYNLPMEGVVDWMHSLGYNYEYWIRDDGVKMFGPYVMVAADYDWMPKGSILETSLGLAMVCDTGEGGWYWTDIATDW